MPLYEPEPATLGQLRGYGYAFWKRAIGDETYHGVFFADDDESERLEDLKSSDDVTFTGVFYKKLRGGNVSKSTQTRPVDVVQLVPLHSGERVDFKVLEDA